jgi:hypothetical protein
VHSRRYPPSTGSARLARAQATGRETARLVDAGQPKREGKSLDRFILRYTIGSRSASLRLTAASIINPFGGQELRQFRCPSIQ